MKEIKDNINRWRDSMFLGRKNQYCDNDYTAKCNLQIQCSPSQITNGIFQRTRTKNFTVHMETQKTPNSQSSLEKEWSCNGAVGINLPDFRLYYKASVIKTVMAQKQKYRPMEQDRSPEINPCTYGYLIFYKRGKNIKCCKDSLFNKWCWENWTVTCKRMKHFLTPSVQLSSVSQSCPTLCDPMNCSTPGLPVQ